MKLSLKEKAMRDERDAGRLMRTFRRMLFAGALAGIAQLALADEDYSADWGPAVGTMAPMLAAKDQHGESRTFDTLTGPNGLIFVFNRSVDW